MLENTSEIAASAAFSNTSPTSPSVPVTEIPAVCAAVLAQVARSLQHLDAATLWAWWQGQSALQITVEPMPQNPQVHAAVASAEVAAAHTQPNEQPNEQPSEQPSEQASEASAEEQVFHDALSQAFDESFADDNTVKIASASVVDANKNDEKPVMHTGPKKSSADRCIELLTWPNKKLLELAKEYGVKGTANKKKEAIIEMLLAVEYPHNS